MGLLCFILGHKYRYDPRREDKPPMIELKRKYEFLVPMSCLRCGETIIGIAGPGGWEYLHA